MKDDDEKASVVINHCKEGQFVVDTRRESKSRWDKNVPSIDAHLNVALLCTLLKEKLLQG